MKKTTKIEARIIGEQSAGMVAVEIYENDSLVWSHDYFANGASNEYYCLVTERYVEKDCVNAVDWRDYVGCDRDEDGEIVEYDTYETTGVVASWTPENGWEFGDDDYGMTGDVVIDGKKISDHISHS